MPTENESTFMLFFTLPIDTTFEVMAQLYTSKDLSLLYALPQSTLQLHLHLHPHLTTPVGIFECQ